MRRFGLSGNPIDHSLSPKLFAAAYPDSDMVYDLVQTENFEDAFRIFQESYEAINITAPFKEDAFRSAGWADSLATKTGASNLLVKGRDKVMAYNTDCIAVKELLESLNPASAPGSRRVLVVGCGGAGKAAATASSEAGSETCIANRNFNKAREFCTTLPNARPAHLTGDDIADFNPDIVIYTIPTECPEISRAIAGAGAVIEANYRNPHLKGLCYDSGIDYIPGEEWLLRQAICGFRIMTGKEPDGDIKKIFRV